MDRFHALADATRRKIIESLAEHGELSATQIADQFSISPQAISQHLKVLRDARWVVVEKRAQQRIYRINPEAAAEMEEWAVQLRRMWDQRLDALDRIIETEKRRLEGGEQGDHL
jgi:DNA-binding transcriptional ArsR family regulator